jgi:soluble lytic murein transglycosylase-like protein
MFYLVKSLLKISLFVFCAVTFSFPLQAKSKKQDDYFQGCPVEHAIRVSDIIVARRYSVLANCDAQLIKGVTVALPDLPPVMRIQGVKEDIESDRQKRERRDRQSTLATTESLASTLAPPPFDHEIQQAAAEHSIDPLFLHALIQTESAYGPTRVSHAGAVGLMQIMPATGRMLGLAKRQLLEPAMNIDAGARYLKQLQRLYGRDFELILSAYNAGPGAVARHGNKIPPYRETRAYVRKVIDRYDNLRRAQMTTPWSRSQ